MSNSSSLFHFVKIEVIFNPANRMWCLLIVSCFIIILWRLNKEPVNICTSFKRNYCRTLSINYFISLNRGAIYPSQDVPSRALFSQRSLQTRSHGYVGEGGWQNHRSVEVWPIFEPPCLRALFVCYHFWSKKKREFHGFDCNNFFIILYLIKVHPVYEIMRIEWI